MQRSDNYYTLVTVRDGATTLLNAVRFRAFSGGATSSSAVKDRPGGAETQRSYGGPSEVSDVSVSTTPDNALNDLWPTLHALAGGAYMEVTRQPHDGRGVVTGRGRTIKGTLASVNEPESDTNNGGRAVLTLGMSVDGTWS